MESKVLIIEHNSYSLGDDGLEKKIEARLKDIVKKYKRGWFVHSANTEITTWTWMDQRWNPSRLTRSFLQTATVVLHQEQKNGNHKKR